MLTLKQERQTSLQRRNKSRGGDDLWQLATHTPPTFKDKPVDTWAAGLGILRGFMTGSTYFGEHGCGSMYGKSGQLVEIGSALLSGMGIRATARKVGCSKNTVGKLYKILLAERSRRGMGDILCPCGLPSIHQGWCTERFRRSPQRQAFMKEWHRERATPLPGSYEKALLCAEKELAAMEPRRQNLKAAIQGLERLGMTRASPWRGGP